MNKQDRPIGIFDSGLGGLTVVRRLRALLPKEHLIYLGDTARVPYGNKSRKTIQQFSRQDIRFLLSKGVKLVVVACNTATALALDHLRARYRVPVLGVVQPGVDASVRLTKNHRIGVIATAATVHSGAYAKAVRGKSRRCCVVSQACPLLVPLVEEGWGNNRLTRDMIRHYLRPLVRQSVDTIILGCTHYPLLKVAIRQVAGHRVQLVDSAQSCAAAVRNFLNAENLASRRSARGKLGLFVTDRPDSFSKSARLFLGTKSPLARLVEL
jgi:glutamate racemase